MEGREMSDTRCACGCQQFVPLATHTSRKQGYVKGQPMRFISGHNARVPGLLYGTKRPPLNPSGLCGCGCGNLAPLASKTNSKLGHIKGQPVQFIPNHQTRGELHPDWKGGIRTNRGYVYIHSPNHPRVDSHGYVPQHVLIAEKALGRYIFPPIVVHHINGVKNDNRRENLLICPDNAYHTLIHRRMRALAACGNANYYRCPYCKKYDDPALMRKRGNTTSNTVVYYHVACQKERDHARWAMIYSSTKAIDHTAQT